MPPTYTRRGDDGTTGLLGKTRLPKFHLRIECLGAIDEASAALGMARALSSDPQTGVILKEIQRDLYAIMAEIAATSENTERFQTLDQERVKWLESKLGILTALVPMPNEFILPGDSIPGGALDLARTIIRRAERRVAELIDRSEIENKVILIYLNRLSSLCFTLEIFENVRSGKITTLAKEK